jgi:two-component system, OmpR family, sensor kinase
MFAKSIRWRLQLWVAFLLACVLSGFGVTVYQLQRIHLLNQIDEDLGRQVSVLSGTVRGGGGPPPFDRGPGSRTSEHGPGRFGFKDMPGPPPGEMDQEPPGAGPGGPFGPGNHLRSPPDRPFPMPPSEGGPLSARQRQPSPAATNQLAAATTNSPHEGAGPPHSGPERHVGPGQRQPSFPDGPFSGPPNEERPFGLWPRQFSAAATNLFTAASTNGFYLAFWWPDEKLAMQSTNTPADLVRPARLPTDTRVHTRTREGRREAYHFTEIGDCALAGCSLASFTSAMHRFTGLLLAAGGVVLAFGLGGGWWLTGHAIRPIAEISATAGRISAGNLAERIDMAEADTELGQLAAVLNSTFARLEAAFAQQRQFTADASHELRTPLAVIISEAQTALARERNAAEYRETLEDCLGTAQQMRRLVESLLQLARFDAGQEQIRRESFDLSQVARECVDLVRPLAERRRIAMDAELAAIQCPGDAGRIGQVITNLLTNAIGFNRDEGRVRISVSAQDSVALVQVQDTGPGIPAEDLRRIFERFYRVDKARSSIQGRTGLGLAICRAIVEAHGGSIEVASVPGSGSTFTVKLPLK